MDQECCRIIIKGRVQGVFFRKFTKIAADNYSVKGFVKNQPDGSVYVEACADKTSLEKFIQWCYQGPDHAQVDSVDTSEMDSCNFSDFKIAYF